MVIYGYVIEGYLNRSINTAMRKTRAPSPPKNILRGAQMITKYPEAQATGSTALQVWSSIDKTNRIGVKPKKMLSSCTTLKRIQPKPSKLFKRSETSNASSRLNFTEQLSNFSYSKAKRVDNYPQSAAQSTGSFGQLV